MVGLGMADAAGTEGDNKDIPVLWWTRCKTRPSQWTDTPAFQRANAGDGKASQQLRTMEPRDKFLALQVTFTPKSTHARPRLLKHTVELVREWCISKDMLQTPPEEDELGVDSSDDDDVQPGAGGEGGGGTGGEETASGEEPEADLLEAAVAAATVQGDGRAGREAAPATDTGGRDRRARGRASVPAPAASAAPKRKLPSRSTRNPRIAPDSSDSSNSSDGCGGGVVRPGVVRPPSAGTRQRCTSASNTR